MLPVDASGTIPCTHTRGSAPDPLLRQSRARSRTRGIALDPRPCRRLHGCEPEVKGRHVYARESSTRSRSSAPRRSSAVSGPRRVVCAMFAMHLYSPPVIPQTHCSTRSLETGVSTMDTHIRCYCSAKCSSAFPNATFLIISYPLPLKSPNPCNPPSAHSPLWWPKCTGIAACGPGCFPAAQSHCHGWRYRQHCAIDWQSQPTKTIPLHPPSPGDRHLVTVSPPPRPLGERRTLWGRFQGGGGRVVISTLL